MAGGKRPDRTIPSFWAGPEPEPAPREQDIVEVIEELYRRIWDDGGARRERLVSALLAVGGVGIAAGYFGWVVFKSLAG